MKAWVEVQAKLGQHSNSSDYVRDLLRRDRVRREAILRMQALVTEGMESGIGENTMDELEKSEGVPDFSQFSSHSGPEAVIGCAFIGLNVT